MLDDLGWHDTATSLARSLRVVVLYDAPESDSPELLDVLVQRDAITQSLKSLGHQAIHLSATLDLNGLRQTLIQLQPDVVFNLVESLGGSDRLMAVIPLLLESMGLRFTGCGSEAIVNTNDKLAAKRRLLSAGLPTARAYFLDHESLHELGTGRGHVDSIIVKAIGEHASLGLDDTAVRQVSDVDGIALAIQQQQQRLGKACFAESFIHGREWNVSLLAGQTLPIAEIQFEHWPDDKPRIVGFDAKWNEASEAFHHTPRTFGLGLEDQPLISKVATMSTRCWEVFALRGAARVDWRVDREGRPWILEVNANPCLSPDAGFIAACQQAGLDYDHMVQRLLADAHGHAV
ncbi:MAG: hypothetical protein R3B96_01485 [Pirellulaceae bacterium]